MSRNSAGKTSDEREFSIQFLRSFLFGVALLLGGSALLNRAVDPFLAFGGGIAGQLDEQSYAADSRVGKAELARRYDGPSFILGSSRARIGYDPQSPAIPDGPACNLGLAGTNFDEVRRVFDFIVEQPNTRRVLLILDFQQFSTGRTVNADFGMSRFNSSQSDFEYGCNLLFNEHTSRNSIELLGRACSGDEPRFTELGFDRPEYRETRQFPDDVVAKTLRGCLTNPATLRGFRYSPERVDALRAMAVTCRERDIELIMIMHPVHALQLEAVRAAGLWPLFEEWKRDVVSIGEQSSHSVWDFTGYQGYSSEALVGATAAPPGEWTWWWDPSHCRAELGNLVLERVFGDVADDECSGVRLTSGNIIAHSRRICAQRNAWMQENPDAVRFVEQVATNAGYEPQTVE